MQFSDTIHRLSEWMNSVRVWMESLAVQHGYFGIFLINLIGALSIFFPIPYTVVTFTLGGLKNNEGAWVFEPVWIAVAAGIGSAVGEFSGYLLGFGGRRVIEGRYKEKMEFLVKVFSKFGPIMIFLFALTPLPDDLLFIPLGVLGYSIKRALVSALIGKFFMNLIVAYSGRFTIKIIEDIFGVESTWISALIGMVLAIALLVIAFVIMFKVDWEKYFEKYVTEEEDDDPSRSNNKPRKTSKDHPL